MEKEIVESLPKFKELKSYRFKDSSLFMYIPVLDYNPVYACRYLTRADLMDSYNLLKKTFKEISEGKVKHSLIADTILYCKENFEWYIALVKEASELLRESSVEIPYDKCPLSSIKDLGGNRGNSPIKVYHPFGVYYDGKRKNYYAEYLKFNRSDNDPINNYRIKYIVEQYELNEFMGASYPSWYSLSDLTIYEKYCTKTNTRIRIDFKDGKLHYFIAGASDNWEEIENVPDNMIYVIFALLFRTMDVNTIEENEIY